MVVTLSGENSFSWQIEQRRLVDNFVSEYGDLALERLDGEEVDYGRIQESLTSLPFLATKKMAVLRAPSKNKRFVENIEQLLADIPETTELVIVEPKLDKRLSYYKYLRKHTEFRDFPQLEQNGLASWLVETAKRDGGAFSLSDAHYLIERVGLNQQLLASELEKLLLNSPKITRQTIDLSTEASPHSTIFQLIDAVFEGNLKKAYELYSEQRALKVEPAQIIAMITRQLSILALLKSAGDRSNDQIAKETGLHPFVINKSQSIARKVTMAEIRKMASDLLEIDIKSKSSYLNPDEALQNYLLNLAKI
jgi:DNA polymerase-3 subunit delta